MTKHEGVEFDANCSLVTTSLGTDGGGYGVGIGLTDFKPSGGPSDWRSLAGAFVNLTFVLVCI